MAFGLEQNAKPNDGLPRTTGEDNHTAAAAHVASQMKNLCWHRVDSRVGRRQIPIVLSVGGRSLDNCR